jgi:preprotein translocase subunit SecG
MLKQINKLCKPSYVYLVLSAITIIIMMVQNAGASGTYKVGMYQCPCNNTAGIFLGKAIYVAFWTFILDAVCKAGYKSVSWFLVLFPMILGAVLVGLVLMSGGIREGMDPEYQETWKEIALDAALGGAELTALANEEKQPMYEIHKSYQERVQERLRRQSLRYDYVETRIQNELGVDKNRIKTENNLNLDRVTLSKFSTKTTKNTILASLRK